MLAGLHRENKKKLFMFIFPMIIGQLILCESLNGLEMNSDCCCQLQDLTIVSPKIDVRNGDSSLEISWTVYDSGSGVDVNEGNSLELRLAEDFWSELYTIKVGPDKTRTEQLGNGRVRFHAKVIITSQHANGKWLVFFVSVQDRAKIWRAFLWRELRSLGFQIEFEILSPNIPDTVSPEFLDLQMKPLNMDVTRSDQTLEVIWTVKDVGKGMANDGNWISLALEGAIGFSKNQLSLYPDASKTEDLGGGKVRYHAFHKFTKNSGQGKWIIQSASLKDKGGNSFSIPGGTLQIQFHTLVNVISNLEADVTPPELVAIDISPQTVDVRKRGQMLTVAWIICDEGSGVNKHKSNELWIEPDGLHPFREYWIHISSMQGMAESLGDGKVKFSVTVTVSSELPDGKWVVWFMRMIDNDGNWTNLSFEELRRTRLLKSFQLISHKFISRTDLDPPNLVDLSLHGGIMDVENNTSDQQVSVKLKIPKPNKRIGGNVATVMAEVKGKISGVQFQFRKKNTDEWFDIETMDESFPYFVHWEIGNLFPGSYELRAIANQHLKDISISDLINVVIDHEATEEIEDVVHSGNDTKPDTRAIMPKIKLVSPINDASLYCLYYSYQENDVTLKAETEGPVQGVFFERRSKGEKDWFRTNTIWTPPYEDRWDVRYLPGGGYEIRAGIYRYNQSPIYSDSISVRFKAVSADARPRGSERGSRDRYVFVGDHQETTVGLDDGTSIEIPKGLFQEGKVIRVAAVDPGPNAPVTFPERTALQSVGVFRRVETTDAIVVIPRKILLTLPIPDEDGNGVVDRMNISINSLRPYYWEEGSRRWVVLSSFQRAKAKSLTGPGVSRTAIEVLVDRFGIFTLMGIATNAGLNKSLVYPNPFRPNDGDPNTGDPSSGIMFDGLPESTRIKILTLSGTLVREVGPLVERQYRWDVKNAQGEDVASGIYWYLVSSPHESMRGKLAVIR